MKTNLQIAINLARNSVVYRKGEMCPDGELGTDEHGRLQLPKRVTAKVRACRAAATARYRAKNAAKRKRKAA